MKSNKNKMMRDYFFYFLKIRPGLFFIFSPNYLAHSDKIKKTGGKKNKKKYFLFFILFRHINKMPISIKVPIIYLIVSIVIFLFSSIVISTDKWVRIVVNGKEEYLGLFYCK